MTDSNSFATWLRRQLARRDWTQADFARRLNVGTDLVSRWATGKRTPDPKSCDLIADALGVDLDIVLWQAGHRPQTQPIDPSDPRIDIHGLVDRVNWSPGNVKLITRVLRTMIEEG